MQTRVSPKLATNLGPKDKCRPSRFFRTLQESLSRLHKMENYVLGSLASEFLRRFHLHTLLQCHLGEVAHVPYILSI
ncbi:hypothetical protein LENED_002449 [Lentinula edodes]|uniref:Uncharacterized protein n=1 Tax=Lentinula edodes TaxID=5353 RepID=A0A1Q3E0V8_LENED|nr:hypothetical protein LENED_002449 [Lentinula edodes]